MITILLNLLAKIALLILLGFVLCRMGYMSEDFQKSLTFFMMNVACPASLLTTAGNAFDPSESAGMLFIFVVGILFHLVALAIARPISRRLPLTSREQDAYVVMSVFSNTAFVGFPLALELMGSTGLLYAVIFNLAWVLMFFSIGISIFSGQGTFNLKEVLKMPVTLMSVVSILIYVSPLRITGVLLDTLNSVGAMVVPICMMLIGCSLVNVSPLDILRSGKSWLVAALKLFIFPLLMLLAMWLIPGIPNNVKLACCLMSCLPSGSLSVVLARQYGCNPVYCSQTVVQSTLLMIVTIPVYLGFASSLFPVI